MTYPLIFKFTSVIPGTGEAWMFIWDLWWTKKALIDLHISPFYTNYIYYPSGVSLLFNGTILLISILAIPLHYFFSLAVIYNILIFFTFILSGYGMYLLVKHLTKNKTASFISGIIFAFFPYRFIRVLGGHLGLLNTGWLPLYILYLIKLIQNPNKKNAILAALFMAFTVLNIWYYFYFLVIFTGLYILFCLTIDANEIFNRGINFLKRNEALILRKQFLIALLFMIISFFIMVSPYLVPMLLEYRTEKYMVRSLDESEWYSADLIAFFTPSFLHPYFKDSVSTIYNKFTGNGYEQVVFIGYTVFFLSLYAIIKIKNKEIKFWGLVALIFLIISLGPVLHVLGKTEFIGIKEKIQLKIYTFLFNNLPYMNVTRGPSRFSVMTTLSFAILCGYAVKNIFDNFKSRRILKYSTSFIISGFILLEYLSIPITYQDYDVPAFIKDMANEKGDYAILNIPINLESTPLKYQVFSGKKAVYGLVSRVPYYVDKFTDTTPIFKQIKAPESMDDILVQNISKVGKSIFTYYNIKYITINKESYQLSNNFPFDLVTFQKYINLLESAFGKPVYEDNKILVYEAKKDPDPSLFIILGNNWEFYSDNYWKILYTDNGKPTRKTDTNNATILIINPKNYSVEVKLRFNVKELQNNDILYVYLNNKTIEYYSINTTWQEIITPKTMISNGENTVTFYVKSCCKQQMALQNIEIIN
jgi:hypothetical protein